MSYRNSMKTIKLFSHLTFVVYGIQIDTLILHHFGDTLALAKATI